MEGKWHYTGRDTRTVVLMVPNPNGQVMEIKCLGPLDAIKVVGVVQAADGNMQGQLDMIKDQIMDMGKKFQDGWVPQKLLGRDSAP